MPDAPKGGQRALLSVGGLPPLFTTTVDQTSYDPAVTFSLSKAPPHTVFGNPTDNPNTPPDYYVLETTVGGASAFTDLTDAPASYVGSGLKSVRVNAGETGIEFYTPASGGDFSSNTSTSVVNELVVFADTTGKLGRRATGSGLAKLTSGVLSTTADNSTNWDTAYTERAQWDGGATNLVAATGRTSLGLVIGTNVQAYDADLTTWAGVTPASGVATFLATPSSANLKSAVTDETGSGSLVFGTSPAITTPTGIVKGDVGLGNVTNDAQTVAAVVPNTAPSLGQILIGNGAAYAKQTMGTDATLSNTGALTISAGVITLAKMADIATASLIYRKTAGTGAPEVNTLATLKADLLLTGTNSGDQTITLTGDVTGSGVGSFAATIAADSVTFAKIQNITTARLLGRATAGSGDMEEITLGTNLSFTGTTLNASGGGDASTNTATSVLNEVVVFADTTGKLLARATGSGLATLTSGVLGTTANNTTNWDTAYTNNLRWDGGATSLVAATGRTSLALNNVTNDAQTKAAIVPNTAPAAGQILVGNAGGTAYGLNTVGGDATLSALGALTIANDAVTYAKIQNVTTARLLGRATAGSGDTEEITLGTNLSYTGTTLNAASGAAVANPDVQLLGLTAINGSAVTALRSDGAMALSQAIAPTWTAQHAWKFSDAATNTITDVLTVGHNSSGTPSTSYGTGISIQGKSDTTADRTMGQYATRWLTVTDASRKAALCMTAYNQSGAGTSFYVFQSGGASLGNFADPGATILNAGNGFQYGNAASLSGTFLIGNGTSFIASAYKFPTTIGGSGTILQSNGTDFTGTISPTFTGKVTLAVGTTLISPLLYQSGTNLTSPVAGAAEFDGVQNYATLDTTSGRGAIPVEQYFHLTSAGAAITTIANFFGATSNVSLVASAYYEIEIYCFFVKDVTSAVITWTFTNSAAPTAQNIINEFSPITGIVTGTPTATTLNGQISGDNTAAKTIATGSLSGGASHFCHFKIMLKNGTGTSLKIQATSAAGNITPSIGSWWRCRRLSPNNIGTFAA